GHFRQLTHRLMRLSTAAPNIPTKVWGSICAGGDYQEIRRSRPARRCRAARRTRTLWDETDWGDRTMATTYAGSAAGEPTAKELRTVVFASSLGTVFEWYDFYLYGTLAAIIAKQFFSGVNPTAAFIFTLLAFAAGFFVRPFGALVFGRVGDL